MPDRDVKTVKDLIFYQYAKHIARSAFNNADGTEAKKGNYGFIKSTWKKLKSGEISWSNILREDIQFVESEKSCIYCGSEEKLSKEHIVPKTLRINDKCPDCDRIQSVHNIVWACMTCNSTKGTQGLYRFFKGLFEDDKKYYDKIPPLVEKKYLKTIYHCHECAGTLNKEFKKIDYTDLDFDV